MSSIIFTYPFGHIQIYVDQKAQKKAEELIRACPEILRRAYEKGARRFANLLVREIKYCLMVGLPPIGSGVSWKPLSPRTIRSYKSWGFESTHLWYLTGQMYRRIGIFQTRRRNKEIRVGFPVGVRANPPQKGKGKGSRPTLSTLAAILEAGTNRIPPRPLFAPAFKVVGGSSRVKKFIVEELRKELNKYKRTL